MSKKIRTWSTPVCAVNDAVPCPLCGGIAFKPALRCEGYGFVKCKQCGLTQMNPQPTQEELIARYGAEHGNDYLKYELDNEDNFLKLQLLGLKDAGFWKGQRRDKEAPEKRRTPLRFLDIGCATGALLAYMRDNGWNVTGVEISPSADYAVKHRNLDVRKLPLEDNHFDDNSFDVVYASHLIEHLKDPRSFLNEVCRILKPDGALYISTPNIAGFQAGLFGSHWRSAIFDHLYLFSKRSLIKLLKNTGFKIKRIRTWGGLAAGTAPAPVKKIADKAVKFFGAGDVMMIKAAKS